MSLETILAESGLDPQKVKAFGLWDNIVEAAGRIVDHVNHEAQAYADETGSNSMEECIANAKWRILPE